MLSTEQLEKCLKKVNPNIFIFSRADTVNDVMPAGLHVRQGDNNLFLFSVPKGIVPEQNRKEKDGMMIDRGWLEIVAKLVAKKIISSDDGRKVTDYIKKTEAGMVV